jgi:hypothetical protein
MFTIPFGARPTAAIPADYLENVANVDAKKDQYGKTYQYTRRSARPAGLLVHPQIVLKLYHLIRENVPLQEGTEEGFEALICKEIDAGNVDLKQRIGFAMLGQGFISINIWGKGNGLFTQCYSVEKSYPDLTRQPLEESAIACTWDSRILNFECRLWHYYLLTNRTDADKRTYLDTFIAGDLEDEAVCAVPARFHVWNGKPVVRQAV